MYKALFMKSKGFNQIAYEFAVDTFKNDKSLTIFDLRNKLNIAFKIYEKEKRNAKAKAK